MSASVGYVGKDLEAMSFAVNYHHWILSIFAPYLGTRVVEVGAGAGSFSVGQTLEPGGRVFIFVPALSWLYGSFDRAINHYRRYSRADLESKCRAAGFKILISRYFDLAGVLPWGLKYRVLQSRKMEPGAVRFYDLAVVPIAKKLESMVEPPPGKNILLIAEKL